uniref:Uncharacterized protein n=1 Tax=Solanum tuberosum TaxID=4113 RepID=M1DDY1_SOLTU
MNLDDEDIPMISKNLKKLFKKGGNYEKKLPLSKEKEFGNTMYTAWGTSLDNSNEDDAEDMALMAMEDSESDTEKREVPLTTLELTIFLLIGIGVQDPTFLHINILRCAAILPLTTLQLVQDGNAQG